MKTTKIENGFQIDTYPTGHVVTIPVQPETIPVDPTEKEVTPEINIETLSDSDFKKLVLEHLGFKIKQAETVKET